MEIPTIDVDLGHEKIEEEKEGGPSFHCDLCDTEVVHKLAQMFLPGLATACVDNTSGDLFKTPGTVAVDLRNEMIDYLTQRSESFVAESVILEGGPDGEVSDHPFDIISNFVDDFASAKRNLFSRVSGWLLSEKREDRIEDFVQEMEMNGFWSLDRRETIAETLLKNVDFQNSFHCSMSFNSAEELANHVINCSFRPVICQNEGCNAKFCAGHSEKHDSTCPFKIIPCEQKCSDSIMRREMDRHCITVCPMKLVNCPFYAVGCRSAIAQCMIEKHRSDDLHSHLWHLLKGMYKEASGDDLNRRVEQIVEASSSRQLAEARDVRSLNFIVKDIEAKLGPFEVNAVEKNSAETDVPKNEDEEVSDNKTKGGEQSMQTSNTVNSSENAEGSATVNKDSEENTAMVNSSDNAAEGGATVNKDSAENTAMVNSSDNAEVSATVKKDGTENTAKHEDTERNHIENKGSEGRAQASNMENLSDKNEVSLENKDRAQIFNENKDAADSNLKNKGNLESTKTDMEILSDKVGISATNEDSAENSIKKKDNENNNFGDKDNEQSRQNSKMELETEGSAENNGRISTINENSAENSIKDKDIEDNKFGDNSDKDNERSIQNSNKESQGSLENNVKNKDIEDDNSQDAEKVPQFARN